MRDFITGEKLQIIGGEDGHNFSAGTTVEFIREQCEPVYGYLVRGIDDEGTEITQHVLEDDVESV